MTGSSVIEFEFFIMVYILTAMYQLTIDCHPKTGEPLLSVPVLPSVINTPSYEVIMELSEKYPLPSYDLMSEYAYRILAAHNIKLNFSQEDLKKLFLSVEVNNGYIL